MLTNLSPSSDWWKGNKPSKMAKLYRLGNYWLVKIARWLVDRLLDWVTWLIWLIWFWFWFCFICLDLISFDFHVVRLALVGWIKNDWLTWLFDLIVGVIEWLLDLIGWLIDWLIDSLVIDYCSWRDKVWWRTFKAHASARGKLHADLWNRINLQVVSLTS